ncbi:Calponin homology (CH) domain-containing protein [Spironucleus salmonicida]|uniref:Calponin homology (CH) domain-containing protein n=1 Tax=Spironucleus salmonicida TaxID=348837 RepID=V6LS56_9EUKA|nr:Calponin homology (CH) domain-containing protein [Spironucleus salmonicida]|eukprot:EST46526.1 Calponin homology (CH) domain-containing protein [Spironucleus salmonicida]
MDSSQQYLVNWVNLQLKTKGIKISDVKADFHDGFNLVYLLEVISQQKCDKQLQAPKNELFCLNNLQLGINMAKNMVTNLTVDARNFYNGTEIDEKLIYGFIFDLIINYSIKGIQNELLQLIEQQFLIDSTGNLLSSQGTTDSLLTIKQNKLSDKQALLLWCNRIMKPDNIQVANFTTDWINGEALASILHQFNESSINLNDFRQLISCDEDILKTNFKQLLEQMENLMQVEQIISENFVTNQQEKAMITYLTVVYKQFINNKNKKHNIGLIQRYITHKIELQNLYQHIQELIKQIYKNQDEIQSYCKIFQEEIECEQLSENCKNKCEDITTKYSLILSNLQYQRAEYEQLKQNILSLQLEYGHFQKQQYVAKDLIFQEVISYVEERYIESKQLAVQKFIQLTQFQDQQVLDQLALCWKQNSIDGQMKQEMFLQFLHEQKIDIDLINFDVIFTNTHQASFEEFLLIFNQQKSNKDNKESLIKSIELLKNESGEISMKDISQVLSTNEINWIVDQKINSGDMLDLKQFIYLFDE